MRPWTIGICTSNSTSSNLKATLYDFHQILNIVNIYFCQSDYVNLLFTIFSALKKLTLIQ